MLIPHSTDYLDHAPAALMPAMFIQEVLDEGLMVRFMGTELVSRWRRDDTEKFLVLISVPRIVREQCVRARS